MVFQIDVYKPVQDLVKFSFAKYKERKEKIRTLRRFENIQNLGPGICSDNWIFRFADEAGVSLSLIDDHKFANNTEYASNLINFPKSLCLPEEHGSPSVIRGTDVITSGEEKLDGMCKLLRNSAKGIFQKLCLGKKDLETIREQFQNSKPGPRLKSLSAIRDRYPELSPIRYNRERWDFKDPAKLGTITNWLGDRVSLSNDDLNCLFRELGIRWGTTKGTKSLAEDEKQFVFELVLLVLHALDTVTYLSTTLEACDVIDLNQIHYVFHDNGNLSARWQDIKEEVNDLSYTVLLPLFFTKQLYLYRSRMLANLRRRLLEFREERERVLTGDVRHDAINMRMTDTEYTEKAMKLSNIVCISDLLDENEHSLSHTYGDFPLIRKEDVCRMPNESAPVTYFGEIQYQTGHILENFGNRERRTKLDKSLKPYRNSIIRARKDIIAVDGLARQAVVYVFDLAWEDDMIGNVDQPITGIFHSNRHKLLAYLTLIELFCKCSEEKADKQDYYLKKSYSKDSESLKEEVMRFAETKVAERTSAGDEIKLSDIRLAAFNTTNNHTDAAVVVREIIHYLVASKAKLVPVVPVDENDGCYFDVFYPSKKFGDGKLVIDGTISLAGLSTTQGDYFQLYTTDGRALITDVDLRTRSPGVVHLKEGGDLEKKGYYPVIVAPDLSVG